MRVLIVSGVTLARPVGRDSEAWSDLAEASPDWWRELPDDADVFAMRDDRFVLADANIDHFIVILRALRGIQSLTIATAFFPGFDPRAGEHGMEPLQPVQLPKSLRAFSAVNCIAADLFRSALPSLTRVSLSDRFAWNWTGTIMGYPGTRDEVSATFDTLRHLRIHVADPYTVGLSIIDLLADAPALASLDLHLSDAMDTAMAEEECEIIANALAEAEIRRKSAAPVRMGALRQLAIRDMARIDPDIIVSLPESVERLDFHVQVVERVVFGDPRSTWLSIRDALVNLAPELRCGRSSSTHGRRSIGRTWNPGSMSSSPGRSRSSGPTQIVRS